MEKFQKLLEIKKENLEKELSGFAKKDPHLRGDWDSTYPRVPEGAVNDEAADEVEEYSTNLPIEFSLETQLQNVNTALAKIKKGAYGTCEKCGKAITKERLLALPETPLCENCAKY